MRTHMLQIVSGILIPVVLGGCQETSTDPRTQGTATQSGSVGATISPAISRTAAPPTRFRLVITGNVGDVDWSVGPDASGNVETGFVSLGESDDPLNPGLTFLVYAVSRCDVSGFCSLNESGFGPIPRSDITSTGGGLNIKELRLSTNTSASANPDFFITSGVGGPITVEWQKVPGFLFRFKGVTEFLSGEVHQNSHGTTVNYMARVRGSVVTVAIPSSQAGHIGRSQLRDMEIFH